MEPPAATQPIVSYRSRREFFRWITSGTRLVLPYSDAEPEVVMGSRSSLESALRILAGHVSILPATGGAVEDLQRPDAEELDDADIILDEPDPVIMGLVHNGELTAYASHRYWGDEEIADIGVLIHPNYRGQGLGKAIVSSLCAWCFENNIVPMYRVFDDNTISKKIPKKLGFSELIPIFTYGIRRK